MFDARVLAVRYSFASLVALEVSRPAGREVLIDRTNKWGRFACKRVKEAAAHSYNRADEQVASLKQAGQLQDSVQTWTARYGQRPDGSVDLDFTAVRQRMFLTLRGYRDTEDTDPDLSQL